MKKRILIALLAISVTVTSVFGMAACNNADDSINEPPKEETPAPAEPTPEKPEPEVPDPEVPEPEVPAPEENGEKGEQSSAGSFYTLQQAYNKGWLTKGDLMDIAYYHHSVLNNGAQFIPEGYNPSPKAPEVLSGETLTAIKQTYWDNNYKVNNPNNVALDDIIIGDGYYGTYNNCVAVMVWLNDGAVADMIIDYYVGSVRFFYPNINQIRIWVASGTEPSVTNVRPVLDEAKASEIRTAYYNAQKEHFTSEYYTYIKDDVTFRYFGEYSGSYVMFIDAPFYGYAAVLQNIMIDGVLFEYCSGQCLEVYNNGKFYLLDRKFENNLFTQEDLLEISYKLQYGLYTKA